MKKNLTLLIVIALVYSCSTSNDGNGNSTNTVVPIAPSNLTGTVASTTQIDLTWTDNSTNETGFKIERKTVTGVYAVVGTTATDINTFNDTGLNPSTSYIYRVYSNNAVGNSLTYSNEFTLTTSSVINLPTLTTTALSLITSSSAVSGGTISSDGGAPITARGVCWSTSANPTISLPTKTNDGTGTGVYTSNITGLAANTTYYVRAFSTNNVGTAYGNEISITTSQINITGPMLTDVDGNIYQSVTNCNQTWTQRNLNVSKYNDGTPIPEVTDPTQWANLTTGAWCYYNNNPANGASYGKLYNWYAVMGIYDAASSTNPSLRKKLAPSNWHIPTDSEWIQFTDCLGGESIAGGKIKSIGTTQAGTGLWREPNTGATNESGFSGFPGGMRSSNFNALAFFSIGMNGFFWTAEETNATEAMVRILYWDNFEVVRIPVDKKFGYSVRCVKN